MNYEEIIVVFFRRSSFAAAAQQQGAMGTESLLLHHQVAATTSWNSSQSGGGRCLGMAARACRREGKSQQQRQAERGQRSHIAANRARSHNLVARRAVSRSFHMRFWSRLLIIGLYTNGLDGAA